MTGVFERLSITLRKSGGLSDRPTCVRWLQNNLCDRCRVALAAFGNGRAPFEARTTIHGLRGEARCWPLGSAECSSPQIGVQHLRLSSVPGTSDSFGSTFSGDRFAAQQAAEGMSDCGGEACSTGELSRLIAEAICMEHVSDKAAGLAQDIFPAANQLR